MDIWDNKLPPEEQVSDQYKEPPPFPYQCQGSPDYKYPFRPPPSLYSYNQEYCPVEETTRIPPSNQYNQQFRPNSAPLSRRSVRPNRERGYEYSDDLDQSYWQPSPRRQDYNNGNKMAQEIFFEQQRPGSFNSTTIDNGALIFQEAFFRRTEDGNVLRATSITKIEKMSCPPER